jgi:hypothetical protein
MSRSQFTFVVLVAFTATTLPAGGCGAARQARRKEEAWD